MRDTVRDIASGTDFDRALQQTILDRILATVGRWLRELFDLLPALGIGNEVIVALAIAVGVLIVARIVLRSRAQREFWAGDRLETRAGRRLDPWLDAERLAGSGAYLEAAHALCAALLSASARRGEVTLHPSKTTGDYARELRRRGAPTERDFQRFRSRYDRVVYDAQRCSADEYAALLADARPLLSRERAA